MNTVHGHHKGNTTERLLDVNGILDNLRIQLGETIMDAGCGGGYMSLRFAELTGSRGEVIALDRFPVSASDFFAESPFSNIRPVTADISKTTPLLPASIDLLYMSNVYHIFSDSQREGFVSEVRRLLKPGGRLAIVEIDKKDMPFGPPLSGRSSPEELARDIPLENAGCSRAGEHFFMQVFKNSEYEDDK